MYGGWRDVGLAVAGVFSVFYLIRALRDYSNLWRGEYVKLHSELVRTQTAHAADKALWETQRKDFLRQVHEVVTAPVDGIRGEMVGPGLRQDKPTEYLDYSLPSYLKVDLTTPRHVDDSREQLAAWLESKKSQNSQKSQEKKCL